MWKLLLAAFCVANFATEAFAQIPADGTPYAFTLFATDLTNCDTGSACDAVVRILCSSATSDWKECGKTSELGDDNYPVWPEKFNFVYSAAENLRWKFDIVDMDVLFDDPIGSVTLSADEFLQQTEFEIAFKNGLQDGRGSLYVHRRNPDT